MASDRERLAVVETKIDNINDRVKWLEAKITIAGLVGGGIVKYGPEITQAVQVAMDHIRNFV